MVIFYQNKCRIYPFILYCNAKMLLQYYRHIKFEHQHAKNA
jgi:hypothetical protein